VVQRLRGQVSSLKASRDKLLVEVDRQSLEIERLLTDNSALEQVPKVYTSRMVRLGLLHWKCLHVVSYSRGL